MSYKLGYDSEYPRAATAGLFAASLVRITITRAKVILVLVERLKKKTQRNSNHNSSNNKNSNNKRISQAAICILASLSFPTCRFPETPGAAW